MDHRLNVLDLDRSSKMKCEMKMRPERVVDLMERIQRNIGEPAQQRTGAGHYLRREDQLGIMWRWFRKPDGKIKLKVKEI